MVKIKSTLSTKMLMFFRLKVREARVRHTIQKHLLLTVCLRL